MGCGTVRYSTVQYNSSLSGLGRAEKRRVEYSSAQMIRLEQFNQHQVQYLYVM